MEPPLPANDPLPPSSAAPSSAAAPGTLTHFRYIDALRGFAFLLVLTVHVSQAVPALPARPVALAGIYGVQLFFLLSAVTLLRSVAVRSGKETSPTRNFFIRRFFRIAPLFWFGIVAYYLLQGTGPRYWAPNGLNVWHFLSTAVFLHGWRPETLNSVVPGGWSISVEMMFYLGLPFLARWVRSLPLALACTAAALFVSMGLNRVLRPVVAHALASNEQYLTGSFLQFWFPSQFPIFLAGFALYHALHEPRVTQLLSGQIRPAFLALLAVGLVIALSYVRHSTIPMQMWFTGAFALLILALAARPFAVAVNAATSGLGVLSFSCYLNHFAALRLVEHWLPLENFTALPREVLPLAYFASLWVGGLALTVAFSTVTYFLIEKPGIRVGNVLIRALERRSGPALAAADPG